MKCRHCHADISHVFADLGHQPPSNAYLSEQALTEAEVTYPLKVYTCGQCRLVQVPSHTGAADLFTPEYAYFSSVSQSWLAHARSYVDMMTTRFSLGPDSFVVELASNDGYLLQYVKAGGIPCLGIEPTHSTAVAAREKGIETCEEFFGVALGQRLKAQRRPASVIAGNNVLAHVPDINDFVGGIKELLAEDGVATLEFPHLLRLVEDVQFDTIYHEHFSYLSLYSVSRIFEAAGLTIFDVDQLPTHGGSLRIYAKHKDSAAHLLSPNVAAVMTAEQQAGIESDAFYTGLQARAEKVKNDLLDFLIKCKNDGKRVAAYGAAAKGNTLLNFAGVRPDLLPFVCDAAASKQGKFMPGSHIPILDPTALAEFKPDFVVILPWNIKDEVIQSQSHALAEGGQFVIAVPQLTLI